MICACVKLSRGVVGLAMQMQTVSSNDDPESAGRRDTWKRCCSHVFKQILRSLSLSYDFSGDGWKNFAFSPVSYDKILLICVRKL